MLSPEQLSQLNEKYKGLEYLNLPVALADSNFSLLHFNSSFSRLLQQSNSVFQVKDLHNLFENFHEKIQILNQAGLSFGYLHNFIIPTLKLKQSDRVFDLHVSKYNPELDHLDAFSITCVEVTEREKEITKLQEFSEQHIKFLENTSSGVVLHLHGIIQYANPQAFHLLRCEVENYYIGKHIEIAICDEYKSLVNNRIQKILQEENSAPPVEMKFTRFDESTCDVEVFSYPIQYKNQVAIVTIFSDISERKLSERKTLESKLQYSNLVENLKDVIFQTDNDGKFTFLNHAWQNLTGYLIDETIGKPCLDFLEFTPGNTTFFSKVKKLISSGVQTMEYEMVMLTKYGEKKFVDVKIQTIYSNNNTIKGISGVIIDVHSKKLAQVELKKIEETLKNHNKILMSLAKTDEIYQGDFDKALQIIAKQTAETLQTSRVNIWQYHESEHKLSCLVNYDQEKKQFVGCISFHLNQFPKYIHQLFSNRILNVYDCAHDARLEEFKDIYYAPAQIVSTLNISIIIDDKIWGAICIDQRYKNRKWTLEDQSFVRSIADFISLSFLSNQRKIEHVLVGEKDALYRTLIEQAQDSIFIVDEKEKIIEVNESACKLFAYTRDEFLNLELEQLFPKRFLKTNTSVLDPIRKMEHFNKERTLLKNGSEEFIAEVSAICLPNGKIQGIVRDISVRKNQENALKESETRLDLALKGADLGTWDFWIQEDKLIHNKKWGEILGYNFELQTVNESFMNKFVHPDDIDFANKTFQKHLNGETPFYEVTIRMLSSNGEWRWIQDKGKIVEWDAKGKPLRATGIHQDVTALKTYEKEIKQQRNYLQQIINAIPNLIYVKNINDEFVLVNNALAKFLNTTEHALLQYQFAQKKTVNSKIKAMFENDFEIFISRRPTVVFEQEIFDEEKNETKWMQSIKVPLRDSEGNYHEMLCVLTDITELKLKENELAILNLTLEQKATERTTLLELANKELETFNYSVSHDLRTPLRTIDIFAYFLEKNYQNVLDKEGADNIKQIRQSIMKMSSLIDNLLTYSKMGRLDLQFTHLNTEDIVRELIDLISEEESVKHIQFHIANLPEIYADRPMMKQAIHNLLSNAIKFTKTRVKPIIEFYGHVTTDATIIAIRDNGVGFNMDFKDKLFKAFKRLHSEEYFEGTGVGLAIVEKIIKRHNGQIWAESEENSGTTFFIKLPLK